MSRETTDKRIKLMLETRKVDNNKIHKALFVNLRPLDMHALLQKYSGVQVSRNSVVNK